jgi:spore coat protein H
MRYFRICCVVATSLAMLAPSTAASQQKKLAAFYSPDTVQTIHLQVKSEDLQKMKAALPKRIYVPASFRWRDITITNVAVRYKGNSSSRPNQRFKRSFLIRFDKFKRGARFAGLRRVSFDNGVQFGSLFSEPIVTEILRAEGVKTHRANYARVFLNKKFHGVYVNVERIDQSFIAHRLDDPDGSLFKVDLGGPGANLQFIGKDPAAYRRTFEAKSKPASQDIGKLVEFIRNNNQQRRVGDPGVAG